MTKLHAWSWNSTANAWTLLTLPALAPIRKSAQEWLNAEGGVLNLPYLLLIVFGCDRRVMSLPSLLEEIFALKTKRYEQLCGLPHTPHSFMAEGRGQHKVATTSEDNEKVRKDKGPLFLHLTLSYTCHIGVGVGRVLSRVFFFFLHRARKICTFLDLFQKIFCSFWFLNSISKILRRQNHITSQIINVAI